MRASAGGSEGEFVEGCGEGRGRQLELTGTTKLALAVTFSM